MVIDAVDASVVIDLLDDHRRMYPHHRDRCDLCRRATSAISPAYSVRVGVGEEGVE